MERLDRFEVLRPLGRGGMGEVWLARDRTSGDTVALKRLRPEGPEDAARFAREVEALSHLRHQRIVRLVAWGVEGGAPWLAMEHVPGGTLTELVTRRGPLPEREAALLGADLAGALAHAHRSGILHRDIKPDNLLLDAQGAIRLLDFGLTRAIDRVGSLTASGALMGTPVWAAPELLEGHGRRVGATADVYGLGATLYFLLTGCPPFQGASVLAQIEAVVQGALEPPSRKRPGLDPALERIVLRCLAKDPGDRPLDAAALSRELLEWTRRPGRPGDWRLVAALAATACALFLLAATLLPLRDGDRVPPEVELLYRRLELAKARGRLDQALSADPAQPNLLGFRARVRLELMDESGAESDALAALALDPREPMAVGVRLGLEAARDPGGALGRVEAALAVAESAPLLEARARLLVIDRREEARADLERALLLDPGWASARIGLAGLLAPADGERLLALDPSGDLRVQLMRAHLRMAQGDWAGALELVERTGSRAAQVRVVRGRCLLRLERYQEARDELQAASLEAPTPMVLANLGLARVHCGDQGGMRSIDEAIRAAGPSFVIYRARSLAALGRPTSALADIDALLATSPPPELETQARELGAQMRRALDAVSRDPEAALRATEAHLARGHVDEALRLLERARAAAPDDGRLLVARARVLLAAGDGQAAWEALREGLAAIGPDGDPPTLVRAAELLASRGDRQSAGKLLDRLLGKNPMLLEARLLRGELYEAEHQLDAALTEIGVLLDVMPDHAEGRVLRGRIRLAAGGASAALKDAEAALASAPEHLQAELLAGRAASALLDRVRATLSLQRTAGRVERVRDRLDRAHLARGLGQDQEAARELSAALASNPEDFASLKQLLELSNQLARAAPPGELARLTQEGRDAFRRQDNAAVERFATAVLQLAPAHTGALDLLAVASSAGGDMVRARDATRLAWVLTKPEERSLQHRTLRARLEAELGAATTGVLLLRELPPPTNTSEAIQAWLLRSRLRFETGDQAGAERDVEHLLQAVPGQSEALLQRQALAAARGSHPR